MPQQVIRKIAFVGLGLIGASLLRALKQSSLGGKHPIIFQGFDPGFTPEDVACIKREYGLDRFEPEPSSLYDADLIILSAPVRTNISLLEDIRRYIPEGSLVTDVSSTKSVIAEKAWELGISFIGMHPMAGREQQGYRAASAELLTGRLMIICADPHQLDTDISRHFLSLIADAGCITTFMTPEEHDRIVANISHLPQLISTALITYCRDNITSSGPGFASVTRLAGSPWRIWQDIILTNSGNISKELESFAEILKQLAENIKSHNLDDVEAKFSEANSLYQYLQKQSRQ